MHNQVVSLRVFGDKRVIARYAPDMSMDVSPQWGIPEWTVSDRLRKAREFAGIDQFELARRAGLGRNTISNYERGAVTPRRANMLAWAMATGVPIAWLENGETPQSGGGPDGCVSGDVRSKGLEPPTF